MQLNFPLEKGKEDDEESKLNFKISFSTHHTRAQHKSSTGKKYETASKIV